MRQIKTIASYSPDPFDKQVNEALADGWELLKRYHTHDGCFVAELEKEAIPESERKCENCAHRRKRIDEEPCRQCSADARMWEHRS